jgi:hypothetical protein
MWHHRPRPTRSSPTRSSSTSARRALAGRPQAPAGPRAAEATPKAAGGRETKAFDPRSSASGGEGRGVDDRRRAKVPGENYDARPRRRGDRRHHQLHQHLQPLGADRRRPASPQGAGAKGLTAKPWVKTSLAPGSQVVTDYLPRPACRADLDALGFNLVGYGCTTCIGNSGPLPEPIAPPSTRATSSPLGAVGQPQLRRPREPRRAANYLASPPLVVAYASPAR